MNFIAQAGGSEHKILGFANSLHLQAKKIVLFCEFRRNALAIEATFNDKNMLRSCGCGSHLSKCYLEDLEYLNTRSLRLHFVGSSYVKGFKDCHHAVWSNFGITTLQSLELSLVEIWSLKQSCLVFCPTMLLWSKIILSSPISILLFPSRFI